VSAIGTGGGGKGPLAVTEMRGETLADMNRGRIRGWVLIGAVVFAVVAVLSWPDLFYVLVSAALAVVLVAVGLWIHLALPDTEAPR